MSKSVKINSIKFNFDNVTNTITGGTSSNSTLKAGYNSTSSPKENDDINTTYSPALRELSVYDNIAKEGLILREVTMSSNENTVQGCYSDRKCTLEFQESVLGQGISVVITAESSIWE